MRITPKALGKIKWLVQEHDHEVAWHCTLEPVDGAWTITDVYVYPQKCKAVTVRSDVDYDTWYFDLPDEVFNSLRVQGHSHVNMGVSPSSTDLNDQKELRKLYDGDYVFLIVNKRGDIYVKPCSGDWSETRYFKNLFTLPSKEPDFKWKAAAELCMR